MIYFISDTHFSHKGSLHWPNGNARPFQDVVQMNKTIIDNWNSLVRDTDTVYHLGDFAYKTSMSGIKRLFCELRGNIILVKGNHDGRTLKVNKQQPRFDSVHDIVELEYNNKLFVLCHYPIESWKNKSHGAIHLHGHCHGGGTLIKNRLDMSVEAIGYKPISIDDVISLVENGID